MSGSGLQTFSALWRAYGEGRLERSLDLVAADCEITLAESGPTLRGRDGVRAWLAATRHDWRTVTIMYEHVREERPGRVVAVGRLRASSADGTANVDRPLACVAEFGGGRLVRARVFADADVALRYARSGAAR